jgi:hypothetical protein
MAPPLEQGSSGGSAAVWPPDLAGNSAEERLASAYWGFLLLFETYGR